MGQVVREVEQMKDDLPQVRRGEEVEGRDRSEAERRGCAASGTRTPPRLARVAAAASAVVARGVSDVVWWRRWRAPSRVACRGALRRTQVVVPRTYTEFTSRRVLTTEWIEGEKLSQVRFLPCLGACDAADPCRRCRQRSGSEGSCGKGSAARNGLPALLPSGALAAIVAVVVARAFVVRWRGAAAPPRVQDGRSRQVPATPWCAARRLQSKASDVGSLVNVGVVCYLKQLLETGFFHADPHPGEGLRLAEGSGGCFFTRTRTQVRPPFPFRRA